jgi:hypothetical protein
MWCVVLSPVGSVAVRSVPSNESFRQLAIGDCVSLVRFPFRFL